MHKFIFAFAYLLVPLLLATQVGWQPLFNGKSLDGWKQLNSKAQYKIVYRAITGYTILGEPNTFLITEIIGNVCDVMLASPTSMIIIGNTVG